MAEAGWYAAPGEQGMLRYWSGETWTEYRQRAIVPNNELERMLLEFRDFAEFQKAAAAVGGATTPSVSADESPRRANIGEGLGLSLGGGISIGNANGNSSNDGNGSGLSLNLGAFGAPGKVVFLGLVLIVGGFMYMGIAHPTSPSPVELIVQQYSWAIPMIGAAVLLGGLVALIRRSGTFVQDARLVLDKLRGRDSA